MHPQPAINSCGNWGRNSFCVFEKVSFHSPCGVNYLVVVVQCKMNTKRTNACNIDRPIIVDHKTQKQILCSMYKGIVYPQGYFQKRPPAAPGILRNRS